MFDRICRKNGIKHRLTDPFSGPQAAHLGRDDGARRGDDPVHLDRLPVGQGGDGWRAGVAGAASGQLAQVGHGHLTSRSADRGSCPRRQRHRVFPAEPLGVTRGLRPA
jgi:hypothetical protein